MQPNVSSCNDANDFECCVTTALIYSIDDRREGDGLFEKSKGLHVPSKANC
jgi:hypothetical protein